MKFNQLSAAVLITALTACQGDPIYRDRVQIVQTPVAQPCATTRPDHVVPLWKQYSDGQWSAMDLRQKAAAVSRQGLEHQGYGERLDAATGACPEIEQ